MVQTTIPGSDVTSNGVWFAVNGDEETFITRTALVRDLEGIEEIDG